MKLIPRYRGVKVRPYMRFAREILFGLIGLIGVIPIALYAFVIKDKLLQVEVVSISIVVGSIVFWLLFSFLFSRILIEQTVLFAKWDRYARFARFLFENRIVYEKKREKGKTSYKFPRIYLKQNKFDLEVSFELAGSKFQQKFKQIGGDLETTFAMDFMETEDDERFKMYRLAYSALLNRIKISDVSFSYEKGVMLMKNFAWDFLSDPHLLVSGGTGGGKTVFLNALILCLAKVGVVEICDPKRADFVTLGDVSAFEDRVVFDTEDIINKFEEAERVMFARYDFMRKQMAEAGEKDLRKFYEYGLEPYFLVCDEFNSFINSLDYKQRDRVEKALIKLTLLGRQAGVNVILAMQKPTAEDIPTKVRDNMNMRIVVGRLSDMGYDMMFGDVNRNKEFKFMKYVGGMRVFGRGYSAVNGEVAREFYSPLLEKGFSFHEAYSKLERRDNPFDGRVSVPGQQVQEGESSDEYEVLELKSLDDFVSQNELSMKTVKRLIDLLETNEKYQFFSDDAGEFLLSQGDEKVLLWLIAERTATGDTWKELVDSFNEEKVLQ
ncbi:cell division protein FtsK [Streptococcus dysgalactiae subsp. equisimilis]|uniref:FtsK/SpoIIIE domain-containing protein n=1 Tax=Streptococcus dysgalactiae TaxID=1334 RepID=UPI000807EA3C|nr:FtsK/SpoIIIE domain-containing protein [Streptococcus dysgalactiae]OBZ00642.1 cell division protein FtsK [Streptococcus dysgalactiae subsp. equisimilis]